MFVPKSHLELAASVVTVLSVWFVSGKDITGQWIMLLAQVLWFVFALRNRHAWLAVQSLVLFAFTVRALFVWGGA